MALKEASATGGLWSATTAWVGGVVPVLGDEVVLAATSGNITVTALAECKSLDATNYKNTLAIEAELKVVTGNLKLGTEGAVTFTAAGVLVLLSKTITILKITTAGKTLPGKVQIKGESPEPSYKLEDNLTCATLELIKGSGALILYAEGRTITVTEYLETQVGTTIGGTGMAIKVSSASAKENCRLSGGGGASGTLELLTANSACNLNGGWPGKVVIAADGIEIRQIGATGVKTLVLNTAGLSTGTKFKVANAYAIEQIETNATPGAKVRMVSETKGQIWKLTKASGVMELENVEVQDCTAEGGATFIAHGTETGVDGGNNLGWLFFRDPVKVGRCHGVASADLGSRF